MRRTARRYWSALVACGLLIIPAYGASPVRSSTRPARPFLAAATGQHHVLQVLSTVAPPAIPAISTRGKGEVVAAIAGGSNRLQAGRRPSVSRGGPQTPIALPDGLSAAVSIAHGFVWPARGPITSGFGFRRHPIFGTPEMHTGIDIGTPWGTPVLAARDGRVTYAGWMTGYGRMVVIDHGGAVTTSYSHLSRIAARPGQVVERGEEIGRVGNTGYSTGPHLLFEIRVKGRPLDPLKYL